MHAPWLVLNGSGTKPSKNVQGTYLSVFDLGVTRPKGGKSAPQVVFLRRRHTQMHAVCRQRKKALGEHLPAQGRVTLECACAPLWSKCSYFTRGLFEQSLGRDVNLQQYKHTTATHVTTNKFLLLGAVYLYFSLLCRSSWLIW